ncbi:MAG: hypothetical protein BAJALOKI2v1_740021 [Promethearchaeota archaeon]|nr:MAG: hypothetical protein BAJALOKI2v1_740021 [Candidatus Lokiarchaeota archaeon]
MENKKDIILGILLIVIVALSGALGFLLIFPPSQIKEPTLLRGLPDDWSGAPNSAYFTLYNKTDTVKITLKNILDGVELAIEQEEDTSGAMINEYKDIIYYDTFFHEGFGLYITGVDILSVLEKFDTNFALNLSFISKRNTKGAVETLQLSSADIIKHMYAGEEEPIILAIAANKTWLADSPIGDICGNFSIFGQNMPNSLTNLDRIEVIDSWRIKINVNGNFEKYIYPSDITTNPTVESYSYERNDWWDFDRKYWGKTLASIIAGTSAAGKNYEVRIWSVDGYASPRPYGSKKEPPYSRNDVEQGIDPPWTDADLVNESGVPLPDPGNKLMTLVYKHQEFGETGQNVTDPVWPYPKACGYHRGPFYLVVPGRVRDVFAKWINRIEISY